jgi:NADH-quinone oxidoreductase subunit M
MLFFLDNFSINLITCLVIYLPLFLFFIILCIPNEYIYFIKIISLLGTFLLFLISVYILLLYSCSINSFDYSWFEFKYYSEAVIYLFNIKYVLGLDGISLVLIVLTTLLIPICILVNITVINYRFKEYVLILIFLEILLLNTFSVLNLLFFYIFFESVLIPMFLIIGI